MIKPNLFRFATSELSQDAMLCWLAEWANPAAAEHDRLLHCLGQSFLNLVFSNHGVERSQPINHIEIKRQHKNIDVLVTIDNAFALCFEDKAGTSEHSDQLQRYVNVLKAEGFSEDHILPVYIQTGEQSSYRSVTAAGYAVIHRPQLIELLREYLCQGGSDSIALDFHDHLANIERAVQAFRTLPFADWEWNAWQGFYSELQRVLGEGNWGYVATPTGGFLGYWWHWHSESGCQQFIQIQEGCLCFKISVDEPARRSELRSLWLARILAASREMNFSAVRPQRLGMGQTMTVAVDGEYRIANNEGVLDLDATVQVLRTAADVLDRAATSGPPNAPSA
jgi:PD-(D/E)XK nuclease superfamily